MSVASTKCPKCGCVQLKTPKCSSCGHLLDAQSQPIGTLQKGSSSESYIKPEKPSSTHSGEPSPPRSESSCDHCGTVFPAEEMIQYDGHLICQTCKPVFLQKLKEGHSPLAQMVYGGFWIRFVAKFIDGLLIYFVNSILSLILSPLLGVSPPPTTGRPDPNLLMANMLKTIPLILLQWAVAVSYVTFFLGKFQATAGKMALGLKVVLPDGGKVSYLRAFGRYFAEILSGITLLTGYIMAGFDEEKRTLHDRICNTRVVKK